MLLLDRADFPRDKSCGDGIAPHVFDRLAAIGVTGVEDGWTPLTRLELARGEPVGGPADGPAGLRHPARGLRRPAGRARGGRAARRCAGTGSATSTDDGVVLDGRSARRSSSAPTARTRWSAPHLGLPHGRRALAIRGYAPTPPDRRGTQVIRYGDRRQPAYAWAFDRGDGLSNVGYGELLPDDGDGDPPSRALLLDQLERLLPGSVDGGDHWRGHHLPLSGWRWDQPDGRVLLAGDAAGLVNPMTGEGIYYAVATGIAAGRAAAARDPRAAARTAGALHRRAVRGRCSAATSSTPGRPPGWPSSPADRRRRHPGGPPRPPGLRRPRRARARRRPDHAAGWSRGLARGLRAAQAALPVTREGAAACRS